MDGPIAADALAAHVAGLELRDDPLRTDVLVVDLGDGATALDPDTRRRMRRYPGPIIGVADATVGGDVAAAVDLALVAQGTSPAPDQPTAGGWVSVDVVVDALEQVRAAVARNPIATRVLLDVLRDEQHDDVDAGLTVESTAYSALLAGPEFARWLAEREAAPARPADGDPVRIEQHDDEVRVVLDRPQVHNAMDAPMREALTDALAAVAHHDAHRIVLTGAGSSFCSGGDLAEFGRASDPVSAHLIRTTRSPARLLAELAPRVVARVHGACVGAGVELAAFAGRVEAAPDTVFRLPELTMGLIPGAGGTVSLPARIGRQRTTWLALTGVALDAPTALGWGLVDAVA